MARLTAIAGGIGSGKSVVSRILRTMGYKVYNCDAEARRLMDSDVTIKRDIARLIAADAILENGEIDRRRLAAIVFADETLLATLNGIVHKAVRDDLLAWSAAAGGRLWVESAIIYESGIDRMVDEVWEVTAPVELRIERVMKRNGLSREEVLSRIASQSRVPEHPHRCITTLINDGVTPLLPRLLRLLH